MPYFNEQHSQRAYREREKDRKVGTNGKVKRRRGKHGSKQENEVAERKKEHEVDVTHHDNIVNEIPPNALSIFVQLCLHTTEVCGRGRGNHCTLQLFQIVNVRVGTGDDHAANFGCIAVTWRDSKERWKTPRCERYDQNGLLDTHGGGGTHTEVETGECLHKHIHIYTNEGIQMHLSFVGGTDRCGLGLPMLQ